MPPCCNFDCGPYLLDIQPAVQSPHVGHIVSRAQSGSKEARDGLLRYANGNFAGIDDSSWYLEGRIAEGIGLADVAAEFYAKIAKPVRLSGTGAYELAQVRLARINPH